MNFYRQCGLLTASCVLLLTASLFAAEPANTITYNGKAYYINGINVPWNQFGSDAGSHYQWGALYDSSFFTSFFKGCKDYGVNCVRLWIHCDGRSTPEFDATGSVTGLDTNFLSNLDDIFKIAAENNVMIMPCLWSFDMTKDFTAAAGKYAGMHSDLIKDSLKTVSYVNNALVPMVKHLANTCNLFAYEIINEPEWSIKGPGTTVQLVSDKEMVRFCGMIAEAIHANSTKMVTVGSACLKWSSPRQGPAESHYWSDSSFQAAYKKTGAYLDFYQIHYYDWMYNPDWGYDPFQTGRSPAYWKLDKPALIGESPGIAGKYTVSQMVNAAFTNGYAGIMPWSFNAKDGFGDWESIKKELKTFRDAHPALVDFTCGVSGVKYSASQSKQNVQALEYLIHSDSFDKNSTMTVFNMQGRAVWAGRTAGWPGWANKNLSFKGIYLCQITNGKHGNYYEGKINIYR
jgi:hypothetical protein